MRYTTILDLRDLPILYKNANVVRVYYHLVLIAGYEDRNKDWARISFRRLAAEMDITLSAAIHAIKMLERYKIITRKQGYIYVRKWLPEPTITKRQNQNVGSVDAHLYKKT